ncbi:MAG TPA: hypothetical protein VFT31_14415 [Kribbella sp.]|nr:hypothetical protein [Kribbella sp.]
MHLATYTGLLHESEQALADAFRRVGSHHRDEPDVYYQCESLARQVDLQVEALAPVVQRYGEQRDPEPEQLQAAEFGGTRTGGIGLLRDLQDLYVLASFVDITWTVIGQAAQGLRDHELIEIVSSRQQDTARQLTWLQTRIKQSAPQVLIMAK